MMFNFTGGFMFWTSTAYAMAGGGADGAAGGGMMAFMPLILMFAVFYLLLIRPQQKKAKAHNAMLIALQRGEYIVTNAGLLGRIKDIDGDIMVVDLGEVKVRMLRSAVAARTDSSGKIEPHGR
jgi:preprotein translocase subunit YajC